jgi:hypothetical protein
MTEDRDVCMQCPENRKHHIAPSAQQLGLSDTSDGVEVSIQTLYSRSVGSNEQPSSNMAVAWEVLGGILYLLLAGPEYSARERQVSGSVSIAAINIKNISLITTSLLTFGLISTCRDEA